MFGYVRMVIVSVAICALFGAATNSIFAGTVIKLSLGAGATDIVFDGTELSTFNDGNGGTTGDQNTAVDFVDFLSFYPDIPTTTASFTLEGLNPDGNASLFPVVNPFLVIQNFTGGSLSLYDSANTLLLSGDLDNSVLTGNLGPPGTGSLYTTSFATVTGGTLAPYIVANSLTLAMSLNDVNGGDGFSVTNIEGFELDSFTADATASIGGDRLIPEPASIALLLIGSAVTAAALRRRRRR